MLDRFRHDPAKIVSFAGPATAARSAELAPTVFEFASRKDPLAVALVQETADAAARIIDRLVDGRAALISLIGGLAQPLAPWLPCRVHNFLAAPQNDPLEGAILLARRAFRRDREPKKTRRSSAA